MEPFSILCRSCAARLKVTKASAVGQVLACPKCGTMIKVAAPEGWIAPESQTDISTSDVSAEQLSDSLDVRGANFDDIEHILAKPQQSARPAKKMARNKSRRQSSPVPHPPAKKPKRRFKSALDPQSSNAKAGPPSHQPVPASTSQSSLIDGPVLPNEQWTSDESRQRKRIVTAIVGVLGTFFLLAAVGTAIVFNANKSIPVSSNQPPADPTMEGGTKLADNDDHERLDERDLADAGLALTANNNDAANGSIVDVGSDPPIVSGNPLVDDSPPPIVRKPGIADSTVSEPTNIGEVGRIDPNKLKPQAQDTDAPPKLEMKSPFAGTQANQEGPLAIEPTNKSNRSEQVGMVEAFESDLGDLSGLLAASGTSILEFQDLTASIRTRQLVGIPKYIVSFPEPSKLDLQKQLEIPIGGIKYDGATLMRVTQDLSAITGIPITVDARSIAAVGKSSNPEVSIKISDMNLDETLTELLTPLGFSHIAGPFGVTIGVFPFQPMTPKTFRIPGVPDIDDTGRKRLVASIQVLIEPESWARTDNPATIKLDGDEIVVNCSTGSQNQIQSLLSKLDSSLTLNQKPGDAIALKNTNSRWKSIKPILSKDPKLAHSVQTEIGVFLNKLRLKTGVSTIIDWQLVINEGWTPQTIVPGNIREPTVEATIAELARAMDLTYTAVDATTLMITTFEQAARLVDLEVYPLTSLVPDRLAAEQLIQLVSESLGAQLQSESVRFSYEPSFHCLVVSAPQQIQRQIEALVDRLRSELVTPERRPAKTQQVKK